MASKRTKNARVAHIIFSILHFICLLGPFFYFIPAAFIAGEVVQKLALGLTTILALVFAAISLLVDVKHRAGLHRSILWILVLGLLMSLAAIKPFIWIMAIASIVDELVFVKLAEHFKTVKNTNKEIDKALNR